MPLDQLPLDFTGVALTSFDALTTKAASARRGYHSDPFVDLLCGPCPKRAPIINRGTHLRVTAVTQLSCALIHASGPATQLVVLGAGLDTLALRLLDEFPHLRVAEVDSPQILALKAATLGAATSRLETRLVAVPGDVTDVPALEANLIAAGFLAPQVFTVFVAECLLVYLRPELTDTLIEWVGTHTAALVVYEQILPDDAFGRVMVRNLAVRGCPLEGLRVYKTTEDHCERYRRRGFAAAQGLDMNALYGKLFDSSEQARISKLELFDEFEEWVLMCAHYMALVAVTETARTRLKGRAEGALLVFKDLKL